MASLNRMLNGRKRINIYHVKMKLQKRTGGSVLNPIGSLQGAAWQIVEGFDLKNVECGEGHHRFRLHTRASGPGIRL